MFGADVGVGLGAIQPHVDRRIEARAREQLRQSAIAVGSGDQVEVRRLLGNRGAIMLRHASEEPELEAGPRALEARQSAQAPEHALLGVFANRAGVEQDHVGVFGTLGAAVPGAAHDRADRLRVGDIHLASVGLEIDLRLPRLLRIRFHRDEDKS